MRQYISEFLNRDIKIVEQLNLEARFQLQMHTFIWTPTQRGV